MNIYINVYYIMHLITIFIVSTQQRNIRFNQNIQYQNSKSNTQYCNNHLDFILLVQNPQLYDDACDIWHHYNDSLEATFRSRVLQVDSLDQSNQPDLSSFNSGGQVILGPIDDSNLGGEQVTSSDLSNPSSDQESNFTSSSNSNIFPSSSNNTNSTDLSNSDISSANQDIVGSIDNSSPDSEQSSSSSENLNSSSNQISNSTSSIDSSNSSPLASNNLTDSIDFPSSSYNNTLNETSSSNSSVLLSSSSNLTSSSGNYVTNSTSPANASLPLLSNNITYPTNISNSTSSAPSPPRITIYNFKNLQYYAMVYIGNQGPFKVYLDSGATWFWIKSNEIPSNKGPKGLNNYSCLNDPQCSIINNSVTINYLRGFVQGEVVSSNIDFGAGLVVKNQKFGWIHNSNGYETISVDGWWGIGLNYLNTGFSSFLDNLYQQGAILYRSFSLYLTNNTSSEDNNSQLIIGDYDPAYIKSGYNMTYIPLTSPYYWQVGLTSISMGSIDLGLTSINTLIDNGVPVLAIIQKDWLNVCKIIYSINKSCYQVGGNIVCDCPTYESVKSFPSLNISLKTANGNANFVIQSKHYISYSNNQCTLLIRKKSRDSTVATIGAVFFHNYYTYFDFENKSIGLAPRSDVN